MHDSLALYKLQQLFYPPDGSVTTTALIILDLRVENITSCRESSDTGCGVFVYNKGCNCFEIGSGRIAETYYLYSWYDYADSKYSQMLHSVFANRACNSYLRIDYAAVDTLSRFVRGLTCNANGMRSCILSMRIQEVESADDLDIPLYTLVSWVS